MNRTLVTFHAHPDDEVIATGGTIAKAAAQGHRIVLVVATDGSEGEIVEGVLGDGEDLTTRRYNETLRAADILGIARVEFLGYRDSGMVGEPTNDAERSFWQADVQAAAKRLAEILQDENADVLTVYDDHGGYGHPDHIQVHRVGIAAAALDGTPVVLEATMNRDQMRRGILEAAASGVGLPEDFDPPDFDTAQIGMPEELITTAVDVSAYLEQKRAAMAAHASQIGPESFFLAMPPEIFARAFGTEWFVRRGAPPATHETNVFDALAR